MTLYGDLRSTVRRAAKSVAYQWPGVIDKEDVEQSIWLKLLESEGSAEKILAMDDKAQYRAVVGIGHQIASRERTDYDHFSGNFRYSVDEAKQLLKNEVLTEPSDHFDAGVVDLMEALGTLSVKTPQYADAILKRYADGEVPNTSTESSALSRALTGLTNEMNRASRIRFAQRDGGPGSRKAISNASAQARSTYDESGYLPYAGGDFGPYETNWVEGGRI